MKQRVRKQEFQKKRKRGMLGKGVYALKRELELLHPLQTMTWNDELSISN